MALTVNHRRHCRLSWTETYTDVKSDAARQLCVIPWEQQQSSLPLPPRVRHGPPTPPPTPPPPNQKPI